MSVCVHADEPRYELQDYQEVIDELNILWNADMKLPMDDEAALNVMLQKMPAQFKESLYDAYCEASSTPSEISIIASNRGCSRAYRELYQEEMLSIGGCVYLESGVETLGNNYRPVYVQVIEAGSYKYYDRTYFAASTGITWSKVGSESITVKYSGTMVTPEGIILPTAKTVTVTYWAQ